MRFEFEGEVWYWRGPSPFHFVTVPEDHCHEIKALAGFVTYGWGMIPTKVSVGDTSWKTALWPKDERYIVPLKDAVRRAEDLDIGDLVKVDLEVIGKSH